MSSIDCRAHLKACKGVFVGVARNCEPHLHEVLKNLTRLAALYGEASFAFVVSDSKDGTISILVDWLAKGQCGCVIDLGNLERQMPLRTQRLAFVRNACMDQVRNNAEASYDHLIVVDMDDVLAAPVSADVFAKAAHWLDDAAPRGAVFANARPRYYDIWALRHEVWCPYDCWHPVWYRDKNQNEHQLQICEVFSRMIKIPLWLPPIQVLSAFGGIGIYKLRLTATARYVGLDERRRETCEHVAFNAAVRKAGGQLYIFPALVTQSPAQHLDHFRAFPNRLRPLMLMQRMLGTFRWWFVGPLR